MVRKSCNPTSAIIIAQPKSKSGTSSKHPRWWRIGKIHLKRLWYDYGGTDAVGLAWVSLKNDENLTRPLIRKRWRGFFIYAFLPLNQFNTHQHTEKQVINLVDNMVLFIQNIYNQVFKQHSSLLLDFESWARNPSQSEEVPTLPTNLGTHSSWSRKCYVTSVEFFAIAVNL